MERTDLAAPESVRFASSGNLDGQYQQMLEDCAIRLEEATRNGDRDAAAKLTREKRFILDSISKRQSTPAGRECPDPSAHNIFKDCSVDELRAVRAALIMHGKEVGTVCLQCSNYNETPIGRETRRSVEIH